MTKPTNGLHSLLADKVSQLQDERRALLDLIAEVQTMLWKSDLKEGTLPHSAMVKLEQALKKYRESLR